MKVSVIVTNYNYGIYLERCIRSLMEQSYPQDKYEVIIVDDASTDISHAVHEKIRGIYPNIRILENPTNVGVAESSNRGIRESLGQFVIRVDADDYVNKNFLLFLSEYLESNNDIFGVGCDYVKIDNNEEVIGRYYSAKEPISCGVMYKKDWLIEAGLYNSDFRHCEEKELRARMGDKYKIDYLRMPLYRYRIHGANKTTQVAELKKFDDKIREVHNLSEDLPMGTSNTSNV